MKKSAGRQRLPVRLQKRAPRRSLAPLVRGLDSVLLEDVGNRSTRDFVAQTGESALDSRVTPARIAQSHAEDEIRDLGLDPWSARFFPPRTVVPLARNQAAEPRHDGVRRDDGRHFLKDTPAESFSLHRQATAFVIGQTNTPATQLAFQDPVLFDQVVDDVLLMPIDPAGNGDEKQLPRVEECSCRPMLLAQQRASARKREEFVPKTADLLYRKPPRSDYLRSDRVFGQDAIIEVKNAA